MLTETEPRAAAYVNLYAVLGALPELCRRVPIRATFRASGRSSGPPRTSRNASSRSSFVPLETIRPSWMKVT